MSSSDSSRYSYGFRFSFDFGDGLVANGLGGQRFPWPLEYASRVFHSATDPEKEDEDLVALVGLVDEPVCAISITPSLGAFGVSFPHGSDGGKSPRYWFYTAAVRYPSALHELPAEQVEYRQDQMFNTHVDFEAVMDGESMPIAAQLRPNGTVRLVVGPWDTGEVRDWAPCPGLDPETLWIPVPEFDDYRAIEVRERPILDLIREML